MKAADRAATSSGRTLTIRPRVAANLPGGAEDPEAGSATAGLPLDRVWFEPLEQGRPVHTARGGIPDHSKVLLSASGLPSARTQTVARSSRGMNSGPPAHRPASP